MTKCIVFNKGYNYQLKQRYQVATGLRPERAVGNDFVSLAATGRLTLQAGYAWDGASGAPDVTSVMRASLIHDGLYQLMREGLLDADDFRDDADELFYEVCVEDSLPKALARTAYLAIRALGAGFADPAHDRPPTYAPAECEA